MSNTFEFNLSIGQISELTSKTTDTDIRNSLQLAERTVRVLPATESPYEYVLSKEEA